jgi:hypothetical protein
MEIRGYPHTRSDRTANATPLPGSITYHLPVAIIGDISK